MGALLAKDPSVAWSQCKVSIVPTLPGRCGVPGRGGGGPGKAGEPGTGTQGIKEPCRESSKWGFPSDRKIQARL